MEKDFAKFLASKEARKNWEKAKSEAKSGGFPQYDDGRYKLKWSRGYIQKNNSDEWQAIHEYKFASGDYKNKPLKKWFNLEKDIKVRFLIQDLGLLGYDEADLDQITDIHAELNGRKPVVFVTLKTNGEYQNAWLQSVVETESEEEEEESDDTDTNADDVDNDTDSDDDEADEEDADDSDDEKVSKKKSDEDSDDVEDEDEEDEDEDEDEEDEDEKKSPKKKSAKSDEEDEDEEKEDEDDEEDESDDKADDAEEEKPKRKPGRPAKEEEADEDTETLTIETGMKIKAVFKGKIVVGKVVRIIDDEGKVVLKLADGTKVKVGADAIKGEA